MVVTTPRLALRATAVAAALFAALPALATNGMNMEGYGPISTGMGGASQAMDHGAAAMAQNPATLALMGDGARLDVALGLLGPDVRASAGPMGAQSGGTEYIMPALGYVRRSGRLVYGLGVFAQGGMGTEYKGDSFLAAGSGDPVRSELGVGRIMLPLAFDLTPEFAVGATLDFMWAGLDLRTAAPAAQLGGLHVGAVVGHVVAASSELVGRLARASVEVELVVCEQVHRQVAPQVIAQCRAVLAEERLGVYARVDQLVDSAFGRLVTQVAVVIVDHCRLFGVWELVQWHEHRLELHGLAKAGLLVVEQQVDPGHQRGHQQASAWYRSDLAGPGRGRVDVYDPRAVCDLGHHVALVV